MAKLEAVFDEDENKVVETTSDDISTITEEEVSSYMADIKVEEFTGVVDSFREYLRDIGKYPLLTLEEEQYLTRDYKENKTKESRDELVKHNLRLVINIAKKYTGSGIPILDLVQEGNLGLMRAVESYDVDKGFRFSTYATWWIKQAVTRSISNNSRLIRLPVHAGEALHRYNNFIKDWYESNTSLPLPSNEEIANQIGVTETVLRQVINYIGEPVSLSSPVGEEQDSTIGDFIPDNSIDIVGYAEQSALHDTIYECLDKLRENERDIIIKRFGLDGGNPMTLEEVGKIYGVTRERIRQIEAKGIRKLRHPKQSRLLKPYMEK